MTANGLETAWRFGTDLSKINKLALVTFELALNSRIRCAFSNVKHQGHLFSLSMPFVLNIRPSIVNQHQSNFAFAINCDRGQHSQLCFVTFPDFITPGTGSGR